MRKIEIYDTTLRDGAQQQGVNFSIEDKLKVAGLLHDFGVDLVEGGWPGAIPKDTDFFRASPHPLASFGATRKPGAKAAEDPQLQALISAQLENENSAKVVTVVAKSDIRHVEKALRTTAEENLEMVRDTVSEIRAQGLQALVDAEHYFDGFNFDSEYSLSVIKAAFESGARCVVLCDTNGGMLPNQVSEVVAKTLRYLQENGAPLTDSADDSGSDAKPYLGIHAHNDTGCAVANTIAAVQAGAAHVQGCVNEYGERTGNANLLTVVANLELKLGLKTVPDLARCYSLAHNIAEIANINLNTRQPYVGDIAFAHKAGLHASAIKVDPNLYQHIDPSLVGNNLKMIISEMAGRSSIELKAAELGFSATPETISKLTETVKQKEMAGYAFDSADASFELLMLEALGKKPDFFTVESWRIIAEHSALMPEDEAPSEATVKISVKNKRFIQTAEGNGPVNALDAALREALTSVYPQIANFELTDYRVRLLDTSHGTDSVTRVLITCYDRARNESWTTMGVGPNIVESSWEALVDCYIFGLNSI